MSDKPRVTRTELLQFQVSLDTEKTPQYYPEVQILCDGTWEVQKGDILKLTYTLTLAYWSGVVSKLELLNKLLNDPKVLIQVSTRELTDGRCLIQDVLTQIAKIQEKIQPTVKKPSWWVRFKNYLGEEI
jgi:hypothetical protein